MSSHTVRPRWISRKVATKTHPASPKARGIAAFMNSPTNMTASSIRRVRGSSAGTRVTAQAV